MSEQKRSKVAERVKGLITIHGIDTLFPHPAPIAKFDFMTKMCPSVHLCPFMIRSRCHNTAELTVATAKAFANHILAECERVESMKKEQ